MLIDLERVNNFYCVYFCEKQKKKHERGVWCKLKLMFYYAEIVHEQLHFEKMRCSTVKIVDVHTSFI
jgi:hypothetical protein